MIQARLFARGFAAVLAVLLLLTGCSALGLFNTVVAKDSASRFAARGIPYGPDRRQKLDIYEPVGKGNGGVVVFAYGGSWDSGSRRNYSFVGRAFAAQGFLTVVFDYRLVPNVRYPAFVQDSAKAIAWAHDHARQYGADPDRLYLVGHSAGAYNIMMTALAPEFLRAEGLSPSAVKAAVGLSGPYDFLPFDLQVTRRAFKGVRNLGKTQPVNRPQAGRYAPPVLLAHGLEDDVVEPRNSRELARELRATGHAVEEKYYPDLDHRGTLLSLAAPLRGDAPVLRDVVDFLRRH